MHSHLALSFTGFFILMLEISSKFVKLLWVEQPFNKLAHIFVCNLFSCQSTPHNVAVNLFLVIFIAKLTVKRNKIVILCPNSIVVCKVSHAKFGNPIIELLYIGIYSWLLQKQSLLLFWLKNFACWLVFVLLFKVLHWVLIL
jgi:hypothetical protein